MIKFIGIIQMIRTKWPCLTNPALHVYKYVSIYSFLIRKSSFLFEQLSPPSNLNYFSETHTLEPV